MGLEFCQCPMRAHGDRACLLSEDLRDLFVGLLLEVAQDDQRLFLGLEAAQRLSELGEDLVLRQRVFGLERLMIHRREPFMVHR